RTVTRAASLDESDEEQPTGTGGLRRDDAEARVVHATPVIAGGNPEEERDRNEDHRGEAAHEEGDTRSLQCLEEDVAAKDVGPEHVAAGIAQGGTAVERGGGERGGGAALLEVHGEHTLHAP